jgi:uncharacterized protein YkwD
VRFRISVLLLACIGVLVLPANAIAQDNACYEWLAGESEMADKLNRYRVNHDRQELHLDPEASRVARKWSNRMENSGTLRDPPESFVKKYLTDWDTVGPIVGTGDSVRSLFRQMKKSETHAREMLRRMFHHVGVGVVKDGKRVWVTVLFVDTNPGTTLNMPDCP